MRNHHRTRILPTAVLLAFLAGLQGNPEAGDMPPEELDAARRLTWERQTRPQGIEALRRLLSEYPRQPAVQEALGEVLCWRDDTRPEGIRLLRQALEQEPGRQSARLRHD